MKDIVLFTKYLDYESEEIKELNLKGHNFLYRKSIFFENKDIILETVLKLKKGKKSEIEEKMKNFQKSRKEKQPYDMPSAGSTFKRGKDYITAELIDKCGLKGKQIGGAVVSNKHAGFIINAGGATSTDIIELIEYVKKVVYEKTGKNIELELEIIGEQ